jgi:hypothetical protein
MEFSSQQTFCSPLPREIEESLLKVLVDHCSLHFLEFDGADYSALRASASCFTTHLDLCVLANPLAPSFNVNSVFSKFSSLTDGSAWRQVFGVVVALLCSEPMLHRCKTLH